MTAHEAAGAVKADKAPKQQRAQKEKEIEQRYEAELAALNAEDPESLIFKPLRQVSHITLVLGSQQALSIRLYRSPPAAPSSSESRILDQPRWSGRVKGRLEKLSPNSVTS
ncbi:hypothetical protein MMC22_004338 [Lobaria immixta]|nr:hypothetical protein [Lobaria immixta]